MAQLSDDLLVRIGGMERGLQDLDKKVDGILICIKDIKFEINGLKGWKNKVIGMAIIIPVILTVILNFQRILALL